MYRTFSILEDLRHESYVIHRLENVLTIVMCAVFSYFTPEAGVFCTKFEAIARLFCATAPFLCTYEFFFSHILHGTA